MRRTTLWVLSTISALVLLFSYRTSTMGAGGEPQAPSGDGTADASDATGATSGSAPEALSGSGSGSGSAAAAGTVTGDSVATQWGPVQVEITVADGRITDATAVVYPQGNHRDVEINSYALPVLEEEAVAAQSADIDAVSGATVTSDGYTTSLQSALDAAHLSS